MEPTASGPGLRGQLRPRVQLKSDLWAILDLGFQLRSLSEPLPQDPPDSTSEGTKSTAPASQTWAWATLDGLEMNQYPLT